MPRRFLDIFLIPLAMAILVPRTGTAQLVSPGALASVHAKIEGVNNCTKCHNFGNKTFRAQCLACHKEIQSRINAARGYHYTSRNVECSTCHKEHGGKNFKLIHFDENNFDHRQAGYTLEGKHAQQTCRKCHTPANIRSADVVSKSAQAKAKTWLGLEQACKGCHKDFHRGQLSQECGNCHDPSGWKTAPKFSHANARFKLVGKHESVACNQCHPNKSDGKSFYGERTFPLFRGVKFGSCEDCHKDAHNGRFGSACDKCHTPASWKQVRFAGVKFDHDRTRYHLAGKHAVTECEKCHRGNNWTMYNGKDLTRCVTCHADYHAGQFAKEDQGECSHCHTVNGFSPSLYEVADHRNARYPLKGAHLAVPCSQCHKETVIEGQKTPKFHWDDFRCTVCHADPHAGQFASTITLKGCEGCHAVETWRNLSFSHDSTRFPLDGKHVKVPCGKCHKTERIAGVETVRYHMEDLRCAACHEDYHRGQLNDPATGATACEKCHSAYGWKEISFDHNAQSRFPLTGKHIGVPCNKCHKKETDAEGKVTIHFKPINPACITCHPEKM